MNQEIKFYHQSASYGYFSNFAHYPIKLRGKTWPTTEHYFQAQKFAGTQHEELIRKAKSPMAAARMGRDRKQADLFLAGNGAGLPRRRRILQPGVSEPDRLRKAGASGRSGAFPRAVRWAPVETRPGTGFRLPDPGRQG